MFNICESAVTVVPTRFHSGLPVCVQLIAAQGHDHIALGAGATVERAYSGFARQQASRTRSFRHVYQPKCAFDLGGKCREATKMAFV